MITTIFSAVAAYVATSIDYVIILLILFSQTMKKGQLKSIIIGQYLGTSILVGASLLAAYGLTLVPTHWVGLLGLIPIYLGIKVWKREEEENDEEDLLSRLSSGKSNRLFVTITVITLAAGGDNIGVYIPYFSTLNPSETIVMLVVFAIMTAVLCYLSYRLAAVKSVSETIEKWERWIVPVVFIGLGILIMVENGTFRFLLDLVN
ncbi:cadmium resistance protein CadD [Planococcus plakortidis]|uniref:Cadmium resistance protein CadD n=1 Tax=Planococcus plakortidis TaxID=1038856 RepID=A0A1C7EAB9_9BACL|nr:MULTISPECIES: CadD family cadmium resistance transporter [Planococcus]ANU20656.1 cadmium resistance protein CadD [Planococcus plakortidis]AUD12447.1 cadmium resistance protein CadD [Planococcus sp. MB-3u-03]PKG47159.1 cadmium resistance protein CadD [Planococcus sp. Urea-trap-24]PKG87645.1 cadmium resistance protein CadD [Planococcus sp. Urea-3u-39]PKG87712.1 cadmium resistance protein CadD [Planococcus sp. Urea-3u-39]